MREADNTLRLELERLHVDLIEAEVDDRKDARSMAKVLGMLPQLVLSVLFICGYFACAWAVFAHAIEIPDNMREMAGALMGIMTLAINTIIKFWFGMTAETK
jgi:4-hydroxybenzoate polyprenyltransferase